MDSSNIAMLFEFSYDLQKPSVLSNKGMIQIVEIEMWETAVLFMLSWLFKRPFFFYRIWTKLEAGFIIKKITV